MSVDPSRWIALARQGVRSARVRREDFDDAVGAALERMTRRGGPVSERDAVLTARSAAIDYLRATYGREHSYRRAAGTAVSIDEHDSVASSRADFDAVAVVDLLERAKLNDKELEVVAALLAGVGASELAKACGVSEAAIHWRQRAARRKLRRLVD